jgi:hypothetical protein
MDLKELIFQEFTIRKILITLLTALKHGTSKMEEELRLQRHPLNILHIKLKVI